jgi:hypothetical protein
MEDVMGGSAVIKTREFRRGITWLYHGIFTCEYATHLKYNLYIYVFVYVPFL